jgi:hypothetical protein
LVTLGLNFGKTSGENTIDFLSQTVKDDFDNDVQSPYIVVVKRLDGKQENILKHLRSLRAKKKSSISFVLNLF